MLITIQEDLPRHFANYIDYSCTLLVKYSCFGEAIHIDDTSIDEARDWCKTRMMLGMATELQHKPEECPEKMRAKEIDSTLGKQLGNDINVSGFNIIFSEREPAIRRYVQSIVAQRCIHTSWKSAFISLLTQICVTNPLLFDRKVIFSIHGKFTPFPFIWQTQTV